jgi:PAS domain S-box-containing protein
VCAALHEIGYGQGTSSGGPQPHAFHSPLGNGTGVMANEITCKSLGWLAGGGETGALIRAKNWSATPLGAPDTWPPNVKAAVSICLNARVPIALWLGPELRLVYNDTYIPFLGETKHPAILGAPGREAWREIWATIEPMHDEVAAGRATSVEDVQLFFARRLPREEVYVSWGYSPILAADGFTIEGTFDACTETTAKVVGERRLATLRDLGARSLEQRTAEVACRDAAEVLHGNPLDIPFAAIYLLDEEGTSARRVAGTRLGDCSTVFPNNHPVIDGSAASGPWPLSRVAETSRSCQIFDLPGTVGIFPAGPWPDPVETAFILPLPAPTQPRPAGFLIAGVSPRRVLDSSYRSFLELVAGHIATNIADARAFEAERKRAEALAEIDRVKTAFFSNVSHEFRTPLTLMMSPIEEILAKPAGEFLPGNRELLEIAHRNSLRLLRLVNTLLDFARVEAGRIQANYEPLDLAALTADVASNFRSACERAGLMLDIDCPPLGEPVYVDREMWEKIVLNLLSNAFKFTLQGRIGLTIRADGTKIRLAVSDTGVGIPVAELPRLFERFHRIESQRGRTHEGTGIGLALVQELVRLHGGDIEVESAVGRGTTFAVTVPLGQAHLPADRISASQSLASTAVGADAFVEEALRWLPTKGDVVPLAEDVTEHLARHSPAPTEDERARVLLADDNADMRDYVSNLLSSRWEVDAVADGQAALDTARHRKPDLVLADIMMPRLDGIDLLSALRRDPELCDVPVILLSARAGEEAQVEGLKAGADSYLVKPFSARELVARVDSSLALARLRGDELAAMSRLHELSTQLTAASDLPSLLREVLDATIELQGAHFGDVQLYDSETRTLEIVAQRGFQRESLDHFGRVDADEGSACGLALKHRTRILIEDVNLDADFAPHRGIAAAAGFRAVQSTPLFHRDSREPVGVLSTYFRRPHRPSARDLRLTDLYARQAADVISFRLTEQRLGESETRLQAAVDLLKLGRYAWDPRTNELQWDDALRAMWGLPAGAHVDYVVWREGVHPNDVARVEAAMQQCVDPKGDGLYDIEYRVIGKTDGVERWIATRGQTQFKNGKPDSFYGVAIDITNRKRIESRLERIVEARTRELEAVNRQLRSQIEQREIAEAAVQQLQRLDAIGQITSGVAHDFNNLLSVVLTNARLLSRKLLGPDDQEGLELISAAAERGAKLTAQLLAFSRKQRLEPQAVDLNSKIAEMSNLLGITLGGTAQLKIILAPHLWPALVDPTQIELIVLNLVINARDAMQSGGTLTLETSNASIEHEPMRPGDPPPGDYVVLAVCDTGIGIPGDVLPRVFEPFFTTKETGKGSGLGLAQVFGFAKQSGGGVHIDTRVGEGTSVKVFLPRAELAKADQNMQLAEARQDRQVRSKLNVLVVDDDNAVLKSATKMLASLGYAAVAAESGGEALKLIASERDFDLVLADFAMPEMNGVELARAIRTIRPNLPVILVIGYGGVDVLKEFDETRILRKPYREDDLIDKIVAALN